MTVQRNTVLPFAPLPVGWLQVPLSREMTDAVRRFEARNGITVVEFILAFLDDELFDIAEGRRPEGDSDHRPGTRSGALERASEFLSEGQVTCVQPTRSESEKPEKSNVKSCEAMQDFADPENSAFAGRPYSHRLSTNQPPSLPAEQARASEQPNTNSAATTIHQLNQFEHSSMNACRRGDDYCRND